MQNNVGIKAYFEEFKSNKDAFVYLKNYINLNLRKKPEEIRTLIEQILDVAEKNQYVEEKAYALSYLGWYYLDKDSLEIALEYGKKAFTILSNSKDNKGFGVACNLMLVCNLYKGQYKEAIQFGIKGLELCEVSNYYNVMQVLLLNTSICYNAMGIHDKAKESLMALRNIPLKEKIEREILYYQNLSETEIGLENIEEAFKAITMAIELNKSFKSDMLAVENTGIIAYIHGCLGRKELAESQFESSSQEALRIKAMNGYINILSKWGRFCLMYGELYKAEEKLKKAYEASKNFKIELYRISILKSLIEVYKKLNKFEEAFKYLEECSTLEKNMLKDSKSNVLEEFDNQKVKKLEYGYKELYDEIAHISSIGKKITNNLNIKDIFKHIYMELKELMEVDVLVIAEKNMENNMLEYTCFMENGEYKKEPSILIDSKKSLGVHCINNNIDILINDLKNEYYNYIDSNIAIKEFGEYNSYMYCPLCIEDEIKGIISVRSRNKNVYTINDLNKLSILSSYIAIAIENGNLYNITKYYANHDYLTGLLNRSNIMQRGLDAIKFLEEEEKIFSIIMIDIDDFKSINDTYGHIIGDSVIKKISEIIKNNVEDIGFSGRYGGEEFLLVLPEIDKKRSYKISDNIRKEIERVSIEGYDEIKITISQGIYEFSQKGINFEDGIHIADMFLYEAKNKGKNRVAYAREDKHEKC